MIRGKDYITPQKPIYTWYISGIYCQLDDYILPTTLYKNLKHPLTIPKQPLSTILRYTNQPVECNIYIYTNIVTFAKGSLGIHGTFFIDLLIYHKNKLGKFTIIPCFLQIYKLYFFLTPFNSHRENGGGPWGWRAPRCRLTHPPCWSPLKGDIPNNFSRNMFGVFLGLTIKGPPIPGLVGAHRKYFRESVYLKFWGPALCYFTMIEWIEALKRPWMLQSSCMTRSTWKHVKTHTLEVPRPLIQ